MEMHFAGPPGCLVRFQKTTCCGARRTARFWVHAAQPLRPGMQVRRLEQVSIGTDRPTKNRGLVRGILHSRRSTAHLALLTAASEAAIWPRTGAFADIKGVSSRVSSL